MQGQCEGPKWLREDSKHKLGRCGKSHVGGHDMMRRVDRNGEAFIWCRRCSGHARQRLGPKLMNQCKTEKMATRKCGHMLKRISPLEEERVPAKNSRGWKIAGEKQKVTRKEYRRLWKEFDVGGSMAQKGLWTDRQTDAHQQRMTHRAGPKSHISITTKFYNLTLRCYEDLTSAPLRLPSWRSSLFQR